MYYGFIYQGKNAKYPVAEKVGAFENKYDALEFANSEWDKNPELQVPRLLTVIQIEKSFEKNLATPKYAFFQFADSASCKQFIAGQERIVWSDEDDQLWNGNAHMMGD